MNRWLLFAATGLTLVGIVRIAGILPTCADRNDFAHYYVSSRTMLEGHNPYHMELAPEYEKYGFEYDERIPNATNPPTLTWFFAPFAILPPSLACMTWQLTQLASLFLIIYLSWRLLADRLNLYGIAVVFGLVAASTPLLWHVYHSQVQLLLGSLVLLGFCCHQREKYTAGCIAIAAAGLLKLFPFVLLPWFLFSSRESLSVKLRRTTMIGAVCLLFVWLTGVDNWISFQQRAMPIITENAVNRTFNFSLPSLIGNLVNAVYQFETPPEVARIVWQIAVGCGLLIIGVAYVLVLRRVRDSESQFCLLTMAMLVGAPTMWGHYLLILIFPTTAIIVSRWSNGSFRLRCLLAVIGLLLVTASPSIHSALSPVCSVLLHYLPLLAIGMLAAVVITGPSTVGVRPCFRLSQVGWLATFRAWQRGDAS